MGPSPSPCEHARHINHQKRIVMSTQTLSRRDAIGSAADLLDHWQGHRRLTRRVIEAVPEDKLFSFSIGSMRPFGNMAVQLGMLAVPTVRGGSDGSGGAIGREWEVSNAVLVA